MFTSALMTLLTTLLSLSPLLLHLTSSFPITTPSSLLLRDPITLRHALGLPPPLSSPPSPYSWTAYNYTAQRVDHFGWSLSTSTFTQRYLINEQQWLRPSDPSGPGPVFLYTGNEGPIETFAANSGLLFDLASEYHALLVFVEHRYYGHSMPFPPFESANASYANTSTLQFLTSQQAIADYAQFVDYLRHDPAFPLCYGNCSTIPVIAFGGSYGGMLAAWLRMKYPHAVDGAIAASAPIWQFTGMTGPEVYSSIVTRAFAQWNDGRCSAGIARSWAIIANLSADEAGRAELARIFTPCGGVLQYGNRTREVLWSFLSTSFQFMAMANYPYDANFLNPLPPNPVEYACNTAFSSVDPATSNDTAILTAVSAIASVYWNYSYAGPCFNWTQQLPASLGAVDGWAWQSCTEMVMPLGQVGPPNDMLYPQPWSLDARIADCQRPRSEGGQDVTPDPNAVVRQYGGVHLEGASRIVFSNGELDPWSGGGVNDSVLEGLYGAGNAKGVVALMMKGAAHHLDLRGGTTRSTRRVCSG